MTSNEGLKKNNGKDPGQPAGAGKTIDLQGVASFVNLVELLAQELGTAPGRIQGMLPNGPATFQDLVGEVTLNTQGFLRSVTLLAQPASPLKMRFFCAWRDGQKNSADGTISGVEAHFFLDATVEQICPQGRALARYVEDVFKVMENMVTLGQSGRLSSMSVSASEIEAFELLQSGNLVSNNVPKRTESFDP
jgi:hypothetical protein